MSNSLSLDVSLKGYRDIQKTEDSFKSLLKTMGVAGERSDKLLQSYQSLASTISKDYVNAVGKLAAAEGRLVSVTKDGNSAEVKRAKLINSRLNSMREQTVMAKELIRTSEEQLRLQVRADNITARQSNEIEKLSNRYAELNTKQATQIARLKEQNRLREESLKSEAKAQLMALRQTQQVREHKQALKELKTAKALEIATLKEQQKAQQQVNASVAQARAGTDRYSVAVRRTAEDLKYYSSSQGEAALRDQARLKGIKQLVTEEANRSQQMDRMARELERLKNGEEAARYALEARLRAAREAAKAEAELALSTGRSSSSSKEATTQLQRHQLELRRLKETSEFYQTAQGREILQVQRRIQAEKRLQQVMADTHINNRLLAQSYSLLTGRSWAAGQATAGMRATLAGLNTSFGMYTSSTILFATAMYTLSRSLRTAITTGAEFEAQMDRVTAVMDATGGMAQFMSREVRDIARVTIFTATEVSEGLMQLGMAGLNTNDAMIALEPSLRLASIGMLDMGRTADIVTNIMVGMNLQMDHLPDVVDDMATAITNSNMTIEQLGNAMSYVAPLTRDADISVQEIIGTLEVLHNTGIKASRAGTAMRTSILALMAPTAKATSVLERYNIRVDDHTGRMRNWTELLGDLAEANLNLADVENLVGKRQAAAFKAMIDSMRVTEQVRIGTDEYGEAIYRQNTRLRESTDRLLQNAGAAQVMQAVMEDNLRGDWLKLVSAVQDKFLEFYDSNSGGMRDAVQSITEFVKELDVDRIDAFFSTAVKWLERLVPLMIGLKTGQLGHSVTSGVAGALAMIPHPAARVASMVLGAGSVAVGAYTGYLGYSAAADGFDFARSAASPDGLNNLDRRTGAYRHTSGKSSNELIQMYHHHERGLEILAMQMSELRAEEARFVVEGRLDEYERQVNSINASVETMTENWQRLNEVMVHNNLAATDEIAENMLSGIDSRLAELEAIRVRLATTGRMAQREHLTGYGDVYRVEQFGTVNEESISDWIESSISAKRASWFSTVGDEQRETHAQALRDYIRTTIEAVDPSETGVDEFMSSIRQRIEDAPEANLIRVSDQERLFAGLRAIYELKVAEARVDAEQNQLLEQRADLVGQLVNGIATAEETQNMLYGQDAAAGIDRVMQTTQEYRDSADELYRLTETAERLRENQTQLLDLERNIAEAYREVTEAMAAREADPDAEVRIAASAMEQARWTEQALELREADLKIRQELIKAAEREEDALRSNVRSLQEQVNLTAASIAASVTRMEFDSSHTLHLNGQNRLYEEQVRLQEEYNTLAAITVTDPRSLEYHSQMLTSMQNRIDLLGREIQLNDQSYRQQQAIQALAARDDQERNLQTLQQSIGLEAQIARYQAEGYWYTSEARAQRDAEVMAQQEVVKALRARYAAAQLDSETSAETLQIMEQSVAAAEDLLHLTEQRSVYQTAEQLKMENTRRIYESLYNGIQQSTVALLESGFKDTQSFFDSLVNSFKRMLAEMAYEAAIKPIVVNMVGSMMPGQAGADFIGTMLGQAAPAAKAGKEAAGGAGMAAAGFPWAAAAVISTGLVVSAINSHNKRDDERMRKFTTEYVKHTNHAGTVLGNIEAQSRSASNSLHLLTEINSELLASTFANISSLQEVGFGVTSLARGSMGAIESGQAANFQGTGWTGGIKQGMEFGGIVGAVPGAIIGGVLGAFGAFGTKKSLQDAGVFIGEATVKEIADGIFEANYYQQIRTTKKRLFRKSSSSSTVLGEDVGVDMRESIQAVMASLTQPIVGLATEWDVLGHINVPATVDVLSTHLQEQIAAVDSAQEDLDAAIKAQRLVGWGESNTRRQQMNAAQAGVNDARKELELAEKSVEEAEDYLNAFTALAEGGYEALIAGFNTNIGKITQGTGNMSFEEQQEQWDKAFSAEGDKLVDQLRDLSEPLDNLLTRWQRAGEEGEGSYEAALRLMAEGAHFERMMQNMGVSIGRTGMAAADLAQEFYAYAGGLEQYNEIFGAYYERFFTEEERARNHLLQVGQVFDQLGEYDEMAGRTLPQTAEAWRQLITEVSEANPENVALIVELQRLAVGADVAQEVLRKLAEQQEAVTKSLTMQLLELTDAEEYLRVTRAEQLAGLTDHQQSLQKSIWEIQDAARAADEASRALDDLKSSIYDMVDAAYALLERSIDAERTRLQEIFNNTEKAIQAEMELNKARQDSVKEQIYTAREAVNSLRKISDALGSAIEGLRIESLEMDKMRRAEAARQIGEAYSTFRTTGKLPDVEELDDALKAVQNPSMDLFGSFAEYAYEQAVIANQLKAMKDEAGVQLSVEEQSLTALESQLEKLEAQKVSLDDQLKLAKMQHDEAMMELEEHLKEAKKQVDAIKGVDQSVMSVEAALAHFNEVALAAADTQHALTLDSMEQQIDMLTQIRDAVKNIRLAATSTPSPDSGESGDGLTGSPITSTPTAPTSPLASKYDFGGSLTGSELRQNVKQWVAEHPDLDWLRSTSTVSRIAGKNASVRFLTQSDSAIRQALQTISADANAYSENLVVPAFANGGFHAGGLRLVGERGAELEATGPARYYTAEQTANMLNQPAVAPDVSSAHDDRWVVLASEIRAARGDMNIMKREIVKELRDIKEYDRKTERHLQRVVKDGVQILDDVE